MRNTLLLLHLLSAIAWLGGMFFAHFCLRPAAVEVLPPPQRLPLMMAALTRFLRAMAVAVPLVLASGFALLPPFGTTGTPPGWHVMLGIGLVMACVYVFIHARLLPTLRAHCAAQSWPQAAEALNRIRRLVMFNLTLGVVVVVAAASAR